MSHIGARPSIKSQSSSLDSLPPGASSPIPYQPSNPRQAPVDGSPSAAQQYPYPATQPPPQANHWNPIHERSYSFVSSYQPERSQPPLSQPTAPPTAPRRSSFRPQFQLQHLIKSSRKSNQENPLSEYQKWVVVNDGEGINPEPSIRAGPSSRPSSLDSLPSGAFPPIPYPPSNSQQSPIDGPPSAAQLYPYPATQPRSQADHWNPIQERSYSFVSSYQSSQPPLSQSAAPSTAPLRSSFRLPSHLQRLIKSSRKSSEKDLGSLSEDQSWVVVNEQQPNLGGGINRFVADPNQQQRQRSMSGIEVLPAPISQSRASLQMATIHPLPPVPDARHRVALQGGDIHLYPEEPQPRREREYSNGGGVVALDSPQVTAQRDKRPKNRNRLSKMIISPEEDIWRLFQECEIAKSNAGLLTNAMTYAKPEAVVAGGADGLIREFYPKCVHSQEVITARIPWATAQSERAREAFLQAHPEAADNPQAHTMEEELLSKVLMAHRELLEAFTVYDESEKITMQEREIREVQERSKVETRLDRTQTRYYAADGSFVTQPAGGAGDSGSQSWSPSPIPPIIQGDHTQAQSSPGPRAGRGSKKW